MSRKPHPSAQSRLPLLIPLPGRFPDSFAFNRRGSSPVWEPIEAASFRPNAVRFWCMDPSGVNGDVAVDDALSVTEHFLVRPVLYVRLGAWPASLHELVEAGLVEVLVGIFCRQERRQLPFISRLDHTSLHQDRPSRLSGDSSHFRRENLSDSYSADHDSEYLRGRVGDGLCAPYTCRSSFVRVKCNLADFVVFERLNYFLHKRQVILNVEMTISPVEQPAYGELVRYKAFDRAQSYAAGV